MKLTKILSVFTALVLMMSLASCDEGSASTGSGGTSSGGNNPSNSQSLNVSEVTSVSNYDQKDTYDTATATKITFNGESATVSGSGATADKGKVTITAEGTYILTGTATDGTVTVNVSKDEKVQLVLDNANITSKSTAAIHVMSADKVKITLAPDTVNRLTDASSYASFINDNEPTGCVFSKDDLTINGSGTLFVTGNYNNGIASKNDVRIINGTVYITAKNHGIKGKDSITLLGGSVSINAGNDGIKSDNELEKGYIVVSGGSLDIRAGDDAIQAFASITVTGGKITASAEGKITNCDGNIDIASGCLTVVNQ